MVSNLVSRALRARTSPTWGALCASPVGEAWALSGKEPAPFTTVRSKVSDFAQAEKEILVDFIRNTVPDIVSLWLQCSVLRVTTTTPRCTGVFAARWEPIRRSSDRTTASPVLGTPPPTSTEPPVCHSARVSLELHLQVPPHDLFVCINSLNYEVFCLC